MIKSVVLKLFFVKTHQKDSSTGYKAVWEQKKQAERKWKVPGGGAGASDASLWCALFPTKNQKTRL
jgi:hypothetical protein